MLKIIVDEGAMEIEMEGKMLTIETELLMAINKIYRRISEKNRSAATVFKDGLQSVIFDNASPVWEVDDTKIRVGGQNSGIRIGMIDLNGCKSAANATRMIFENLHNMGVPLSEIEKLLEGMKK